MCVLGSERVALGNEHGQAFEFEWKPKSMTNRWADQDNGGTVQGQPAAPLAEADLAH
jgi:hypothetical protein